MVEPQENLVLGVMAFHHSPVAVVQSVVAGYLPMAKRFIKDEERGCGCDSCNAYLATFYETNDLERKKHLRRMLRANRLEKETRKENA